MTAAERRMAEGIAVAIIVAWLASELSATDARQDASFMEPLEHVGTTGTTVAPVDDGVRHLCNCAPLGSFGRACKGITWIDLPNALWLGMSNPVELRKKLPVDCGRLTG